MFTKEFKYLFLIIVIFIAACIETDIYLPAFTDMMAFFSISEERIQQLLSWNFIGICLSCPFYGPISDAIGRKKPLMVALTFFLLGSILTVVSTNFELMLFGRVLQGLGSGGCFTLGTAILFDVFAADKAIIALNKINSIIPFIMAAAPILGGYLNATYGFQSNFIAVALCVLASFIICQFFFEETLPQEKRVPFKLKNIARDFTKVLINIPFWQTTCIISLMFACYISFLSMMSVLFVMEFSVAKQNLPYFQGVLLGAWLIANLSNKKALQTLGIANVKRLGVSFFVLGSFFLLVVIAITPKNPYLLTGAMTFYSFGANWTQSIYFPEGMAIFPELKGITASLLTSARLLIAALVVAIVSNLYDATIYPLAFMVVGITVIILALMASYERRKQKKEVLLT